MEAKLCIYCKPFSPLHFRIIIVGIKLDHVWYEMIGQSRHGGSSHAMNSGYADAKVIVIIPHASFYIAYIGPLAKYVRLRVRVRRECRERFRRHCE